MEESTIPRKKCRMCGEFKPLESFYPSKVTPDRLEYKCKPCASKYAYASAKKNPRRMRDNVYRKNLHRVFNLSPEQYNAMCDRQGGRCAICGQFPDDGRNGTREMLSVDHDHATGQIRGLLCSKCNHLLRNAQDRVEILRWAIVYLQRFNES